MFKFRVWEVTLKDTAGYDSIKFRFTNYEVMTNFVKTALECNSKLQVTIIEPEENGGE